MFRSLKSRRQKFKVVSASDDGSFPITNKDKKNKHDDPAFELNEDLFENITFDDFNDSNQNELSQSKEQHQQQQQPEIYMKISKTRYGRYRNREGESGRKTKPGILFVDSTNDHDENHNTNGKQKFDSSSPDRIFCPGSITKFKQASSPGSRTTRTDPITLATESTPASSSYPSDPNTEQDKNHTIPSVSNSNGRHGKSSAKEALQRTISTIPCRGDAASRTNEKMRMMTNNILPPSPPSTTSILRKNGIPTNHDDHDQNDIYSSSLSVRKQMQAEKQKTREEALLRAAMAEKEYWKNIMMKRVLRYGADSIDAADAFMELGGAHMRAKDYMEAVSVFKKTARIYRDHYGNNSLRVARALNQIGLASSLAVKSTKKDHKSSSTDTFTSSSPYNSVTSSSSSYSKVSNPCTPYHSNNNHNNNGNDHNNNLQWALVALNEAFQIRLSHLGQWHCDVVDTLNNIAGIYMHQRQLAKARDAYAEVMVVRAAIFGRDHPSVAVTASTLGTIYILMSNYKEARLHYDYALRIYRGPNMNMKEHHPLVLKAQKGIDKAEKMLKRFKLDNNFQ